MACGARGECGSGARTEAASGSISCLTTAVLAIITEAVQFENSRCAGWVEPIFCEVSVGGTLRLATAYFSL